MRSAAQERIPIKAAYSDMYSKNEKKKLCLRKPEQLGVPFTVSSIQPTKKKQQIIHKINKCTIRNI